MSQPTTGTHDEKSEQEQDVVKETQTPVQVQVTQIQVSSSSAGAGIGRARTGTATGDQESNSKSSSTKSKKSKLSSTPSLTSQRSQNGHANAAHGAPKPHQLLQDRSSQSSTSIILSQPHPPNSWIEQIQFKAQYCHFRCNDYVTVINSARSLDKVEELGAGATAAGLARQLRAEQSKSKISSELQSQSPSTSRQKQQSFDKRATTTTATASVSSPKPPQPHTHTNPLFCWNFPRPRVKLPRLFNAKSLDDITNTKAAAAARRGAKHKDGRSQSSTSHEIHSVLARTSGPTVTATATALKDNNQPGPSSTGQKKGYKKPRRSDEDTCSTEANLGASKLKPSSSSSSSENGATFFRATTTRVIDGTGTGATTTVVEQSQKSTADSSGHSSKKQAGSFINCAKSDSCINRVHVHSSTRIGPGPESASGAQGTHHYSARLESIFIPCCSNPKVIYNHETLTLTPKTTTSSVNNLDIVPLNQQSYHITDIEVDQVDANKSPLTVVPAEDSDLPPSSSKKKISFMKPVNKVSPIQTYTDNYEEVSDETEKAMELPSASGVAPIAKPRLVVTSLSYLQRPMSPSPTAMANTSSTVTVTPGVVMLQKGESDSTATPVGTSNNSNSRNHTKASGNAQGKGTTGANASSKANAGESGTSGAFSIKNYLGELIKEKCITKRTETKHVERVREKVTDKSSNRVPRVPRTGAGVHKNANSSSTSTSKASPSPGPGPSGAAGAAKAKKPETRSVQSPLEVFYDKLETVEERYTSSEPRSRSSQHQSRSSGTSSSVTSPDSGADDFKRARAGTTHQGQEPAAANMSDLQSPQYVKKTAHMFNSKMDSATSILHRTTAATTNTTSTSTTTLGNSDPYYSSSFLLPVTNDSKSNSKDGKVRHIAIERNVNGNGNGAEPSYLNVAKSVSGYHGLAYNSAEKSNGHLLNGSSGLKSAGGGANGVLRTQINTPPQYSSPHKVSFMNDGHDHTDNSDQPPPPLPKSCPPLSSPSLVNTNSSSSYKRVANNSSSVGNEFYEESSEKHHVISSQSQRSGFSPSNKPAVPEKSKVLEQIQKLYGDQPVTGNTPGVLFRRHYSPQRPTETSPPTTAGKVTTIPIQCVNLNSEKENNTNTRNIVINKAQERIIPITVDPYLQESSRAAANARNKTQARDYEERYEKEERIYEGVNVKSSPGRHNLFEFEKYSNTNEVNFNTTPNSNSNTNTSSSKTDLSHNVGKINGSNISQINIHRDNSADKSIHKTSITIPINVQSNGTSTRAGAHSGSGSADNQSEKCKSMSGNFGSADTVDKSSSFAAKSVMTNSVSSSPPKQSNVKIIPVQVRNDLEDDRSRNQNSTRESNMEAARKQPVSSSLNKENDVPASTVVKDGHYFLQEVQNEKTKIQKLIATATEKLEKLDPSSEESGCVQAAIGKARLLINKKFKQFEELCHTNVKEQSQGTSGEPFTTQNDDLAGFWDMVLIQVDQIHQMFRELDPKHQKNSAAGGTPLYQRSALTPRKDALKKTGSPTKSTPGKAKPTTSSSTPNARDEMRRKMIAERRKAMKSDGPTNGTTSSEPDVQIFIPESQS